jgi:hypothetical protein
MTRATSPTYRLAVVDPRDELADLLRGLEEPAGLDVDRLVAANDAAGGHRRVRGLERAPQIRGGQAVGVELVRIELHLDDASGSPDGRHFACAGHALQLHLDRVRDTLEVEGAAFGIARPQRQRDDRDVVDALGLDQGFADVQLLRQPVPVREDRVVQTDDRLGARHADLVLDRDQRLARPRHRPHVLEPPDLRQHLLGGNRDQLLDVLRRGAREGHEHVGHRHVDLRLLLARRDDHGERTRHDEHEREQRRQL